MSFADGIRAQEGDVFGISTAPFGLPLRNPLAVAAADTVALRPL
jgi:hypothetical protein